ncbi:MAG: hypothetical protein ACREA3_06540 [Nitrosotalea sp.]
MSNKTNYYILRMTQFALVFSMFFVPNLSSYGHLYGLNFQEWTNKEKNLLIQFDMDPHSPIAGKPSRMLFSVQNLQTQQHFQNFTETITITNSGNAASSSIIHKFESKEIKDGDFYQEYVFPNGGTYEILVRIDTSNFINVASFTVFISSPQFQILNVIYILLPTIIFIGIIAGIVIVMIRYIYKK